MQPISSFSSVQSQQTHTTAGSPCLNQTEARASNLPNFNSPMTDSSQSNISLSKVGDARKLSSQTLALSENTASVLKQKLSELNLGSPYFSGDVSNESELGEFTNFVNSFNDKEKFAAKVVKDVLTELEPDVLSTIQQLKDNKSELTHVLLKGCPLQPEKEIHTPLPYGKEDLKTKNTAPEWLLVGLANLLGKPMGYTKLKNGQLIHQVTPDSNNMNSLSGAGSKNDLPPHVDAAALFVTPDFLLLGCARTDRDHQAFTSVYPVDQAVSHLSDKDVQILLQPRFAHEMPVAFSNAGDKQDQRPPVSILSKTASGHFQACHSVAFTGAENPQSDKEAHEAVQHLNNSLQKVKIPYHLEPGELLMFSNTRNLHGRNGFKCYGDGHDRWLQRVYVANDLDNKLNMREGTSMCGRIFDNGSVKIT